MNTGTGRWTVIAGACVVLAGAAFLFLRDTTGAKGDSIRSKGQDVLFYCRSCAATGKVHVPWEARFPVKCPQCGEAQAVRGFRCGKCKKVGELPDKAEFPCPHCGQVYTGLASPLKPAPMR